MKRTTARTRPGIAGVIAVTAAVLTLLAVSWPSWIGGNIEAQVLPVITIKHVNPDGSDFTGNPFCPQTVWSADGKAKVVSVDPRHDCNNAAGQHHVIRTEGYDALIPVVGTAETTCDGVDDDADTVVDDGACLWADDDTDNVPAAAITSGTAETACDGVDNDADGDVDDGCAVPELAPAECGDDLDNDGDTVIDDGCVDEDVDDPGNIGEWVLQNVGANATIIGGPAFCWQLADMGATRVPANDLPTYVVPAKPGFSTEDVNEQCIVITSTTSGETTIQAVYDGRATNALVKEWDTFVDTVILKASDVESVTVPGMGAQLLPKDADGDGDRDAADEHLMDHNGETQEHAVIYDEAIKLSKSAEGPIQLIESIHGQHTDFPDHPTEGAVVLAFIDSPRGCTYFTNPADPLSFLGTAVVGVTDWRGLSMGPRVWPVGAQFNAEALAEAAAHGLAPGMSNNGPDTFALGDLIGVHVDTVCEEQATITFKVGYPRFVASVPEISAPEWVRINWVTIELAKQPQIRWAGEEIVLEKRWALPGEWYPELGAGLDNDGDTAVNEDPEDDDGDGLVNEEFPPDGLDTDQDGNEDGTRASPGFGNCNNGIDNDADTDIDAADPSCGPYIDEDTGVNIDEDDDGDCVGYLPTDPFASHDCSISGGIDEDGPDPCPWAGYLVRYTKLGGPGGLIAGLPDIVPPEPSGPDVVWTIVDDSCVSRALYSSEEPGQVDVEALMVDGDLNPINEHAFLVWYLKIYQVKLTNIPLTDGVGREFHNAGMWSGEDPITAGGVTGETLNVSQDALARVQVKGYFYGGNPSGRGDACIDMDGDGDGVDDDGDTLFNEDPADGVDNDGDTQVDEDTQVPGQPYPTPYQGCADVDDGALAGGYWVLPDDIEALAGPNPDRLASWDVMSEPDVAAENLIGYKSALDSHDDVLRPFVECVVLSPVGEPDFNCMRKTVDPDGQITDADAIMPPLKILARILDDGDGVVEAGETGFLKAADKDGDVNIRSAYVRAEIPASLWIPAFVGNGGYEWDSWGFSGPAQGPYTFYDVLTKQEELDTLGRPYIRSFAFYTDNRGLGYFFVNGDFKLTYDDCPRQQLSGTPDCSPSDVVGKTDITVIGDYPYFRKHPAVESNPAEKTWLWGGFKSVTAEPIDATHTAIIAHLKDRDGYCGFEVTPGTPTTVVFSPSLNPVQHEEIEFILNNEDIAGIIDVSPNVIYSAPHLPLGQAAVTGWEEGVIVTPGDAVARAEDARVLGAVARATEAEDECQAWIVVEHPADQDPDVSVVFHDPEGNIDRHWPPLMRVVPLQGGWNEACYTGSIQDPWDAVAGVVDDVLAIYRLRPDQGFDRWFPTRPDISTIGAFSPYDQLFVLMGADADWLQEITPPPAGPPQLSDGWNSVCYTGPTLPPPEATADWGEFAVLYMLQSDWQGWCRYIPGRPEVSNCVELSTFDSALVLVTQASEFCGPVLPGTYNGTVTVNGVPAPDGTTVIASVGGIEWAATTTSGGLYVLDVPQAMPVVPPCFAGGQMAFQADGLSCQESPVWSANLHNLDLTCGQLATRVRIGSGQAPPGGQATVPLEALGVPPSGLGAFTVDVTYEAGVVSPTSYVGDPGGHFDSVLCNLNYGPSIIRCSGIRATPDAVGDLPLADITFEVGPGAPLGHQSPLTLTVATFADAEGYAIPRDTEDGSIHVGLVGDVDCGGEVDAVDALFILQHVVGLRSASNQCPLAPGTLYLPAADAQCDSDVDAVDALFVLQHVVGLRPVLCSGS